MKRTLIDFFNRESARYEQFASRRDFVITLREKVVPLLKGRVLDVGSGSISDFRDGAFDHYLAMDISTGMLKRFKRERRFEPVCGDALALPFRAESFDVLIYRSVLHHLNPEGTKKKKMEERLLQALSEARRVLKGNGKVLVIEPCFSPFLETVENLLAPFIRWGMRHLGVPYVFLFSAGGLSAFLKKGGLENIRLIPIRGGGKGSGWIIPILGLPFFKIPKRFSPSRVHLIEGSKE